MKLSTIQWSVWILKLMACLSGQILPDKRDGIMN